MSISIMIVDDDADDIDIFIEAVSEIDPTITCLQAKNGLTALDLVSAAEHKPDFIFVDMNMPKMSGKQFVAEIRKNKMLDGVKLIIYSTSKPEDNELHGADQFISKPTTQEELCIEISKIISSQYHLTHTMTR
jgi:CheY-like chemotaxis protein